VVALLLALGCSPSDRQAVRPSVYDPARDIDTLFADVQLVGIFSDSKEFVDARPRFPPRVIEVKYDSARRTADFNLRAFVAQHFILPAPAGNDRPTVRPSDRPPMLAHINALWPVLTRQPDSLDPGSSLIPLPSPYVVPGGRFREVYYWDSYFTMQGLVKSGNTGLVKSMLDNFAHLIRTVGHIPNGNRSYYLSRSQPPYFAAMVALYADATDSAQALHIWTRWSGSTPSGWMVRTGCRPASSIAAWFGCPRVWSSIAIGTTPIRRGPSRTGPTSSSA
jgi:alpha,alpha-trehalase